jgi:acyl carrier protein
MAGEMEDAFGIEIEPARFIACNSLEEIIHRIASDIDKATEPQAT